MKPDVSKWQDECAQAEAGMLPYAADWLQNKCFDKGAQWLVKGDGAVVSLVPATEDIKRITVNVYQDHKRTLVSKLTAQQPIPVVTPATSSSDDRNVARECEHLLRYFWRTRSLQEEMDYLAGDVADCGGGWWQVFWDPEAGEDVPYVQPGAVMDLSVEQPPVKYRKSGDVVARFVSALEMRVDPTALRMNDVRWLARVHYMPTSTVKDNWGKDVDADAAGTRPTILTPDWLLNPQRLFARDICRVVEVWHKPNNEYKNGFYIVFSSDTLLHQDDCKELPFFYCPLDPDQDNFFGKTPLSHARRPQIELNSALSMISDGRSRGAFPTWIQQRGANMDIPTGRPHEVLGFNDNHNMPQRIPGDAVSDQLFRISDTFFNMMGATSGIQQSDQSTSGKDRLYAAEQDNTKLGPALRALHGFLKRVGMRMLNLWRDNATTELTYSVGDPNASSDVRSFSAAEIRYKDIDMSIDSALPLNRQARRDMILQWFQAGLINQQQALRMSEFGDTEDMLGTSNLDRERARNENQALYVQPVGVEEFEDHQLHLEEHLAEMKQDKWYIAEDQAKQNFRDHIAVHKQYVQLALGLSTGAEQSLTGQQESGNNGAVGSMADVPAANATNAMVPMQAPVSERDNQGLGVINGRMPLPQQGVEQ